MFHFFCKLLPFRSTVAPLLGETNILYPTCIELLSMHACTRACLSSLPLFSRISPLSLSLWYYKAAGISSLWPHSAQGKSTFSYRHTASTLSHSNGALMDNVWDFSGKTKTLSSSGGKSERLKRPRQGKRKGSCRWIVVNVFVGRGWLPQRCTDIRKTVRFMLLAVLLKRRAECMLSFSFTLLCCLHWSIRNHTLTAPSLTHSHHHLSLLFMTLLELHLKLIISHSHPQRLRLTLISPHLLPPLHLLPSPLPRSLHRHVLVRGVLELHWTSLGEWIWSELVSGETWGGWQRRGRGTAPLPHRCLAGPTLLLPHHAGRTGRQLTGHLRHF